MTDFPLRELADFAWSKGDAEYDYTSPSNCALCQFLKEQKGIERPSVDPWGWGDMNAPSAPDHAIPDPVVEALNHRPWTFLALAGRLECAIAEETAQGIEAEGGNSEAGSVHESPVRQDAPND